MTPESFSEIMDLTLTTALARTVNEYKVEFGQPPVVVLELETDFSVLSDWNGRVLTQGFDIEVVI